MGFKAVTSIFCHVVVKTRKEDDSGFDQDKFMVKFERLPTDDFKQFQQIVLLDKEVPIDDYIQAAEKQFDMLVNKYMLDWTLQEGDQKMEYTPENVAKVMQHPDYRHYIVEAFLTFQKAAGAKN